MDILHIAQKVDVIEDNPKTQERNIYFSRIEDIGATSIFISPPYRKGFYLPPKMGRVITARVAADNCAYLFKATFLSPSVTSIPVWEISLPTDIKKIQMREFVRFNIILDIKIELLDEPHKDKIIMALSKDISAGGVQVVLKEPLPEHSKVKVTMPLGTQAVVEVQGKIVRVLLPETANDRCCAGIMFTDIAEKMRNQIIKYIFSKQAERRQKEKGRAT